MRGNAPAGGCWNGVIGADVLIRALVAEFVVGGGGRTEGLTNKGLM